MDQGKHLHALNSDLEDVRRRYEEGRFAYEDEMSKARMRASGAMGKNEETQKHSMKIFEEELRVLEKLRGMVTDLAMKRAGNGGRIITPSSLVTKELEQTRLRGERYAKKMSEGEETEAGFQGNVYCAELKCGVPDCEARGQKLHLLSKASFVDQDCCDVYKCIVADEEEAIPCDVQSWSTWGACSSPCFSSSGEGIRARTRKIVPDRCVDVPVEEAVVCKTFVGCVNATVAAAKELMLRMKAGLSANETQAAIDAQPCPLSKWSAWSQCDEECGPGHQERHRNITAFDAAVANKCARQPASELAQRRPCFKNVCPVDCKMAPWSPWGECDAACEATPGDAQETRSRTKQRAAEHGGSDCVGDDVLETRPCQSVKLPKCDAEACKPGPWSPWGQCSEPCGPGQQERSRALLVESADAELGAKPCGITLSQVQPCQDKRCNVHSTPMNWWNQRDTHAADVKAGAFERYGGGSVRLAEGHAKGAFSGRMDLGFEGVWELQFRFKPSDDPARDAEDTVKIFVDGERVATLRNKLAGEADGSDPNMFDMPFVRPEGPTDQPLFVYGRSFQYRLEFESSNTRAHSHPVVMMGQGLCKKAFAYNIALRNPADVADGGIGGTQSAISAVGSGAPKEPGFEPNIALSKRVRMSRSEVKAAEDKLPAEVREAAATCDKQTAGLGEPWVYAECTGSPRNILVREEAPEAMKKFFDAGLRGMICPVSRGTTAKAEDERWGYLSLEGKNRDVWQMCVMCEKSFTRDDALSLLEGRVEGKKVCTETCLKQGGCNDVYCSKVCAAVTPPERTVVKKLVKKDPPAVNVPVAAIEILPPT